MIRRLIVIALLALPLVAAAKGKAKPPTEETPKQTAKDVAALKQWETTYQQAASDLGSWVIDKPAAAKLFFAWDGKHPAKTKEFVTWATTKPNESLDMFVTANPKWPLFDKIAANHKEAAEAFVEWCRKYPKAAEELMNHPKGLHWVGNHQYKAYWSAVK